MMPSSPPRSEAFSIVSMAAVLPDSSTPLDIAGVADLRDALGMLGELALEPVARLAVEGAGAGGVVDVGHPHGEALAPPVGGHAREIQRAAVLKQRPARVDAALGLLGRSRLP